MHFVTIAELKGNEPEEAWRTVIYQKENDNWEKANTLVRVLGLQFVKK